MELSTELNVLVYKVSRNPCHQYEAYIAAGNWGRTNSDSSAIKYFQKAIQVDPSKSYAYMLAGYEKLDSDHCLDAKFYFAKCMSANKRCYRAWFGMASCYMHLEMYQGTKNMLWESFRIHPRHPAVLSTLAAVLYKLQEYDKAEVFVKKSLAIKYTKEDKELLDKIMERSSDMWGNEGSSLIY